MKTNINRSFHVPNQNSNGGPSTAPQGTRSTRKTRVSRVRRSTRKIRRLLPALEAIDEEEDWWPKERWTMMDKGRLHVFFLFLAKIYKGLKCVFLFLIEKFLYPQNVWFSKKRPFILQFSWFLLGEFRYFSRHHQRPTPNIQATKRSTATRTVSSSNLKKVQS